MRSSGKNVPCRSFGIRKVMTPTDVASERSRYPFLWLPSAQASSACASMISFTSDSAIMRINSWMFTIPSSNLGISGRTVRSCIKLAIAAISFVSNYFQFKILGDGRSLSFAQNGRYTNFRDTTQSS